MQVKNGESMNIKSQLTQDEAYEQKVNDMAVLDEKNHQAFHLVLAIQPPLPSFHLTWNC